MSLALRFLASLALLCLLSACARNARPQSGGGSATTLGGFNAPTSVVSTAPENPQTPTVTTIEKTTTRDFAAATLRPATHAAGLQNPTGHVTGAEAAPTAPPVAAAPLAREVVIERATTQTGAAQKDTVRELGARLSNTRGVMWVGVLIMVGGPILGWKMGWFTNGCIAGAVGLLLVILATVIPGNEAWFGLGGLLLLPLVAYVYYRARHDAGEPALTPSAAVAPAAKRSARASS